jgi:hypothetical protein
VAEAAVPRVVAREEAAAVPAVLWPGVREEPLERALAVRARSAPQPQTLEPEEVVAAAGRAAAAAAAEVPVPLDS